MNESKIDKELVRKTLTNLINRDSLKLSRSDFEKITSRFSKQILKKGQAFCKVGDVCDQIGVLVEGTLTASYETLKNPRKVSRFYYVPDSIVVSSFKSFSEKIPTNEFIIANDDCILLCLSFDDLQSLYMDGSVMNEIGRYIAENSYLQAIETIRIFQMDNTLEKVHLFFDMHPNLWGKVTIKEIASYLEINRNLVSKHYSSWNKG